MRTIYPLKPTYPLILLGILLGLFLLTHTYDICINVTPSMKQGVYLRETSKISRGDIVALCLEEPYKTLGLTRGYIAKGHRCEGTDPLIKEVIAIPGDEVVLADQFIRVNGVTYPYATFYRDSFHRKLAIYPRGKYSHVQGYWLIGTHSSYSWDSRYWGEVRTNQILYKLKPLWVW